MGNFFEKTLERKPEQTTRNGESTAKNRLSKANFLEILKKGLHFSLIVLYLSYLRETNTFGYLLNGGVFQWLM